MNATDKANSTLAKLRATVADNDPLAKALDAITGLSARIDRLEASTVEAARTAPLPRRKG